MQKTDSAQSDKHLSNVIKINEDQFKDHLGKMVRSTVEETLNDMLDTEADQFDIKHLLADSGYDSEKNFQYARDLRHIKITIPARGERPTTKLPKTIYRREMRTHFDTENYGQWWQVETVLSMIKRNFGSALRARHYWSQCRQMMLLAL